MNGDFLGARCRGITGSANLEFNLWLRGFRDVSLCLFKLFVKELLLNELAMPLRMTSITNLKFLCDSVDFATLLVEKVGIGPKQFCSLLKSSPGLEIADTCATTSTMHAPCCPLQLSE